MATRINELLLKTDHRTFNIPKERWNFYQQWNEVVFLHYRANEQLLKDLIPKDLELDKFNGECWVSLVAFKIAKIRPKGLMSIPPISNFNELNLRTYVTYKNKPGVYFLSIDAGNRLSSFLANSISGLPYQFAEMSHYNNHFKSQNRRNEYLEIEYKVGNKRSKSNLDLWLSERYMVHHDVRDKIISYNVHHLPWELNDLHIETLNVNGFNDLDLTKPDLYHYSPGVEVLTWPKSRI